MAFEYHPAHRPPDPIEGYDIRGLALRMSGGGGTTSSSSSAKQASRQGGEAKRSFLHGRLPRAYAWVRSKSGQARRITILFDTGASHCFVHPRILQALDVQAVPTEGPASLKVADDRAIPCHGVTEDLQVHVARFRQRMPLVVADIGSDDVILGGELLETSQGGFGPAGFWRMLQDGQELLIPLIGEHSSSSRVNRVRGTKKILKLLRANVDHLWVGRVWKTEDAEGMDKASENDSQDRDAQGFQQGQEGIPWQEGGSASMRTSSSRRSRKARQQRRNQEIAAKIEQEKTDMQASSARVKKQLMEEFPEVFQDPPEGLPPLRWTNHRVELEPGARMPAARGLPRMSGAELEETNKWVKDMLSKGWIVPSLAGYGAMFFFVPKPSGKGLRGVCDFRAMNAITKKILPSLPLFENIVTQLDGARYFSGLDMTSMFYQIRVEPGDIDKTAFRTPIGMYAYTVTPMGMTGSVGTAMSVMEQVLQHVVSLPGENLPANPRMRPPLPPQPEFSDTLEEEWWQQEYHTALGHYACIFIDDILCYSKSEEEHVRHLRQICRTLKQHRLYLNPDKCTFCQAEIIYLGNFIGRHGVRPTPERTQTIGKWPEPVNVSELRSFMGFVGFLRRYIRDMAQIAAPLNVLTKKGVPWIWGDAQQRAFDKLKARCVEAPVLAIPGRDAALVVRCDASREAMGVALYQRDADGFLQPIEFKSKAFADPQKKLPAHDREALALLYALRSFRHFLLHRRFEVQTDNSALSQIFTSKDLSDLYSRWYYKLAEFPGMVIKHRPGRKLYCADALSRRRVVEGDDTAPFFVEPGVLFKLVSEEAVSARSTDHAPGRNEDGVHVSLVKDRDHHFSIKVTAASELSAAATVADPADLCAGSAAFKHVSIDDPQMDQYRRDWPDLYKADEDLAEIWKQKGDERWGYFVQHDLLWKFGPAGARLCVPQGASKVPILQAMHDSKLAAHAGIRRTLARAVGNFYWKGMHADVTRYVESCHVCQTAKVDRRKRMGDPRAHSVPDSPWDVVHLDWITGFRPSPEGYDAVLVFVDALTGMVHLQACKKTDTSRDTARHFVHNVVRLHGVPKGVVSDRDIRLRAHFWRALQQRLGTELRFTTAYTPNSNGKVERVNAVLGDVLRSLCDFAGRNWAEQLDLAEFAINGSESRATGFTPFFANYAREPRVPANLGHPRLDVPAAEEFADAMFATVTHTRDALERAKRKFEREAAPKRRPSERYAVGDKVLLSTKNLNLKIDARKLLSKFVGPFEVLSPPKGATNPNVVYLKTPRQFKIHMPVNIKDVKRYKVRDDDLGGPAEEMPEPITVDGEDCYEVEAILAERTEKKTRRRQVLVKWAGLDLLSATWEPLGNMPQLVIDEFRGMQRAMADALSEADTE